MSDGEHRNPWTELDALRRDVDRLKSEVKAIRDHWASIASVGERPDLHGTPTMSTCARTPSHMYEPTPGDPIRCNICGAR